MMPVLNSMCCPGMMMALLLGGQRPMHLERSLGLEAAVIEFVACFEADTGAASLVPIFRGLESQ